MLSINSLAKAVKLIRVRVSCSTKLRNCVLKQMSLNRKIVAIPARERNVSLYLKIFPAKSSYMVLMMKIKSATVVGGNYTELAKTKARSWSLSLPR